MQGTLTREIKKVLDYFYKVYRYKSLYLFPYIQNNSISPILTIPHLKRTSFNHHHKMGWLNYYQNILIKENLYYDASKVKYFGRLVTPAMSPIRFDTQFFLCKIPQKQQNINLFSDELTKGLWGTPKKILELYKVNQIKIIFPQYSTLRRLKKFKTIQEAFDNSKMAFRSNQLIRLR